MGKIYSRIVTEEERQMLIPILEKSTKLAEGWTKYFFPQIVGSGNVEHKHLEHMCWQLAFNSYMDEEYRNIATELRYSGEPPGPILATNYPTYLDFLRMISNTFTTAALKTDFQPCYLSLANTLPVEWVMICDRSKTEAGVGLECAADQLLAQWRKTSAELARYPGVVFRRVFLTSSEVEIPVPRFETFESQLNLHVWTWRDDPDMSTGLDPTIWEKIIEQANIERMPDNIHIRPNSRGFLVSRTSSTTSPTCVVDKVSYSLMTPAKSLREVVLNELHKPPFASTARITDITKEILNSPSLHPTDLLIIGLLPKDKTLSPEYPLILDMIPLIGVECRARDPLSNISVLSLYSKEQIETHLKDWIELLEKNSSPLG